MVPFRNSASRSCVISLSLSLYLCLLFFTRKICIPLSFSRSLSSSRSPSLSRSVVLQFLHVCPSLHPKCPLFFLTLSLSLLLISLSLPLCLSVSLSLSLSLSFSLSVSLSLSLSLGQPPTHHPLWLWSLPLSAAPPPGGGGGLMRITHAAATAFHPALPAAFAEEDEGSQEPKSCCVHRHTPWHPRCYVCNHHTVCSMLAQGLCQGCDNLAQAAMALDNERANTVIKCRRRCIAG